MLSCLIMYLIVDNILHLLYCRRMKNTLTRRVQNNFLSMLAYFYYGFYFTHIKQEGLSGQVQAA